jgi:hypothetical protein
LSCASSSASSSRIGEPAPVRTSVHGTNPSGASDFPQPLIGPGNRSQREVQSGDAALVDGGAGVVADPPKALAQHAEICIEDNIVWNELPRFPQCGSSWFAAGGCSPAMRWPRYSTSRRLRPDGASRNAPSGPCGSN